MKICIVGGIFDKSPEYRAAHSISPETVLVRGLAEWGIDVTGVGHAKASEAPEADVVHMHHFGRAALSMAARKGSFKYVFTSHDPFAMNGLSIGLRRTLTDRYVVGGADAVVALSRTERSFLCAKYGRSAEDVPVIHNGIVADIFRPLPGIQRSSSHLLFVGQLKKFKGLDDLLCALQMVRELHPPVNLTVVSQTAPLLSHYQALAARLGLSGAVSFAGAKSPSQLADLYNSACMLISPSHGECLSTVVLEAMACGCPVIATDVGGIREQLRGEAGAIVPKHEPATLADCISELLSKSRSRAEMGAAGQLIVQKYFNVPRMVEKHIALYRRLLESPERVGYRARFSGRCIQGALRIV